MGSPRKIMVLVAMGGSLAALTALGSVRLGTETTKPDSGHSCCDGGEGAVCQVGTSPSRSSVLLAPLGTVAIQPTASRPQEKASPETLAKGVATRKALLEQVTGLMEDGVADCCVQPGCGLCPISADACDCAASLAKGGPVCPECWGGWQAGHGGLPNVKPEDIKIFSKEILKQIYDSRAEKLKEANK